MRNLMKPALNSKLLLIYAFFVMTYLCIEVMGQATPQAEKRVDSCDEKIYRRTPTNLLQLALVLAISDEKTECVKQILKTGLNPNYKINNELGTNPILVVLVKGNAEIMRELIKAGANVKGHEGQTALIVASAEGYIEIIKILLDAGADINAKVKNKTTALMSASFREREAVVNFLLKSGGDVNVVSEEGLSSLMLSSNNSNIVKALLNAGAKIDVADNKGWTALFYAINDVHFQKLEILLEKGASVNLKDKNKMTPLLLAEQIKDSVQREKIITLLKRYNAKN